MATDGAAVTRQLELEAAERPRAVAASALAGALLLVGSVYGSAGLHPPRIGVVQGLAPALSGISDPHVDPRTATILFTKHHAARLIASSTITAVGIALIAIVLYYLFSAVKARRPELPNFVRPAGTFGPIGVALAGAATAVIVSINARNYINGASRTRHAADHVFSSGAAVAAQVVGVIAELGLAFAFIMLGLNAMRVGLLTRFMGVLAIISGVLFVIPVFGAGLPVVQAFWLLALAFILSGRNPAGLPPAWQAGTAVPWPSQQELREQRQRQSAQRQRDETEEPAPEPVAPQASGGGSRRKRKRR